MKNIKKWIAVLLAMVLCLSLTACAGNQTTASAKLEVSQAAAEGEETAETVKDPAGYDKDIQGLCKYLEDCGVTAGERVQMEYDVIGAENGYKYVYSYNDSSVQLEVYEYAAEGLSAAAQTVVDSVKANGSFELLDKQIPAQISADGRFMLIYTDDRAEKKDQNKAHKEHVVACFEAFTAE